MPDCISDAVLKPDVAGPTKAKGAIKHPDKVTPNAAIINNFLIIDSPVAKYYIFCKQNKRTKFIIFINLEL